MSENGNGAVEQDLTAMTNEEVLALSRASEARANVFRGLSLRYPERFDDRLGELASEAQRYTAELKERGMAPDMVTGNWDPTLTVLDKEGTAPTLADGEGNFAADARTANIGGIGIRDSNTDPDGAMEKLRALSDPEMIKERQAAIKEAQETIAAGGVRPGSTNPVRAAQAEVTEENEAIV